jgi:hypothetical protein
MRADHFTELFFTIMFTTKSSKREIRKYLNVPQQTLDKWLREGLPFAKHFLIIGKLEDYLFERLNAEVN